MRLVARRTAWRASGRGPWASRSQAQPSRQPLAEPRLGSARQLVGLRALLKLNAVFDRAHR